MGGRRMQISRHPNKNGKTRGCVNLFRIARSASNRDIARVAAATRGEWHWITDKRGARVDREVWLRDVWVSAPPAQP
jgi:hypothetical protein